MFSKWRISSQKEGNSRSLFFFQQNCYLQSERGLLQYTDLAKAKNEASIPPAPTQLHPFKKLLAYEI